MDSRVGGSSAEDSTSSIHKVKTVSPWQVRLATLASRELIFTAAINLAVFQSAIDFDKKMDNTSPNQSIAAAVSRSPFDLKVAIEITTKTGMD